METLVEWWKEIIGSLISLVGGVFLFLWKFKDIINWLVEFKEKHWPSKHSSEVPQNGFVRTSFCKLKHEELSSKFESIERSLVAQTDISQRTLEHQIKISEDLGKVKGKLGIE